MLTHLQNRTHLMLQAMQQSTAMGLARDSGAALFRAGQNYGTTFLNQLVTSNFATIRNQALKYGTLAYSLASSATAHGKPLSTEQDTYQDIAGEFALYGMQALSDHPILTAAALSTIGLGLYAGKRLAQNIFFANQSSLPQSQNAIGSAMTVPSDPPQGTELSPSRSTFPVSDVPHELVPFQLDGYDVIKRLGEGGMGITYLVRRHKSGQECVFKMIRPKYAQNKGFRQYFINEVQAYLEFSDSPYIVSAIIITNEPLGVILEYLPNGDLAKFAESLWDSDEQMDMRDALQIFMDCARGLEDIHKRNKYHRDIKPDNVFLYQDPDSGTMRAKLGDFGLVKENMAGRTQASTGTPLFMAPEQIDTSIKPGTSIRSDMFSLGITMYMMLTGKHPFGVDEFTPIEDVKQAILKGELEDPSIFRDDISEHLAHIVLKLLSHDSTGRYQEPMELIRALKICSKDYRKEDDPDTFIF